MRDYADPAMHARHEQRVQENALSPQDQADDQAARAREDTDLAQAREDADLAQARDVDVAQAEADLAAAEERADESDPASRAEVARAEARLAAAEARAEQRPGGTDAAWTGATGTPDGADADRPDIADETEGAYEADPAAGEYGRTAGEAGAFPAEAQPLPPEPPLASPIPLEGMGAARGMYEGPTVAVPEQRTGDDVPFDETPDGARDEAFDEPGDRDRAWDEAPGQAVRGGEPVAGELKPGEAQVAPAGAVWDDDARRQLRDSWREVQLGFVDDPVTTVGEARTLLDEAVDRYTASLAARRQELDGWQSDTADTEVLRSALRGYRDFLDKLLA